MSLSVLETATYVAEIANNKKAYDVQILDIRGLSGIADYFVICSGNSETQVQAITNEIKEKIDEVGMPIKGIEGNQQARWVLIDLGDVIVHVFHKEDRDYYKLERLWADAPRIVLEEKQV